jgi:hypothetical protein
MTACAVRAILAVTVRASRHKDGSRRLIVRSQQSAAASFTIKIDGERMSAARDKTTAAISPSMYRLMELAFAIVLPWATVVWLLMRLFV